MSRRAYGAPVLASCLALVALLAVQPARGAARHNGGLANRPSGFGIGLTRKGLTPTIAPLAPLAPTPLRETPLRETPLRETPAIKPVPVPSADFANPLHRHRMAMPDVTIPALGDLSF